MIGNKHMVLVDTGLFCVGMRIHAGIYYLYRDNYVLLCKNVVFTAELIERLRLVASGQNGVYVDECNYEEIWNESLRQYLDEACGYEETYQRVRQEYSNIVSETVGLLGEVSVSHGVPLRLAEHISDDIVQQLEATSPSLVLNCINMIHQTDDYLYTHSVNVATLNGMIGKWMGLPAETVNRLIKIGLLHDLGKLRVPPDVLNKPGKLSDEEFAQIKHHPIYSCEILMKSGEKDENILQSVRQHHEKMNGRGYPDGLRSEAITLAARITSVSDVYDAMVSKRCYKEAYTPFEILAQFKENKFSDLDIQVVNVFLRNISYLLIGMRVKLSNGETGEVVFVRDNDYANPIVKVGGRVFTTTSACRCVSDGEKQTPF